MIIGGDIVIDLHLQAIAQQLAGLIVVNLVFQVDELTHFRLRQS